MKRTAIVTILILLLIFSGAFLYLSCTEGGLRLLFSVSTGYIPGKASVTSLSGRLIGPLEIAGFRYRGGGLTVSLDRFAADWKPLELLSRRAHIVLLEASGVYIDAEATKKTPPPEPGLPDLHLPLEIVIENTRVTDISVKIPESDATFRIYGVSLEANFSRDVFRIHRLNVGAPLFDLSIAGNLTPQGDYPFDVGVGWFLNPPGFSTVAGSGRLFGSLTRLEVTQKVDTPAKARVAATLFKPLENLQWKASLHLDEFLGEKIGEGFPDVALTGEVASSGTPAHFELQGSFAADWPHYGNVTGDFLGRHQDGVWRLEKLLLEIPGTDAVADFRGEFSQTAGISFFTGEGEWREVTWPLGGKEAPYGSPEGEVRVKGQPEDFSIQVNARLEGRSIPPGEWALSGRRKDGAMHLNTFRGTLLGGKVTGRGIFRWEPVVAWDVAIDGSEIDPGSFAREWPGNLSFAIKSRGGREAGEPQAEIRVTSLSGELRGHPISGRAEISIAGNGYAFPRLELRSGTALISASGAVSDRWNVAWEIDAESLSGLIPHGGGFLEGTGRLSGPRQAPRIDALLSGKDLTAGTVGVGTLRSDIALDLSDREASHIDVSLSDLHAGTRTYDSFALTGTGKLVSHDLSATLSSQEEFYAFSLAGGYENGAWEGTLTRGDLKSKQFGEWSLLAKERIFLSADRAQPGEICLESGPSSICSRVEWMREKGTDLSITVAELPLAIFGPALPAEVALEGRVSANMQGAYTAGGALSGRIDLSSTPGKAAFHLTEDKTITLPFAGSVLSVSLDDKSLFGRLDVTISDEEFVRGTLVLPRFSPFAFQAGNPVLSGGARISLKEPGLVPALFSRLENTSGRIVGNLTFAGTLANPLFTGEVALSQAAADIPGLGTRIEDLRVAASSDGSGLIKIDGEARSNRGKVRLGGTADVGPGKEPSVLIEIDGERFEAIRTPEAWILASPSMTVRLSEKALRFDGRLEIPEAIIEPRDLSGAVTPSEDVTVIREEAREEKEEELEVYSTIRIILGDKVSFEGFGLSGQITGSILAVDEPNRLTTGTGELEILEGRYEAYGQKLEIEKGQLLFFGGPIDNPGLDIRAVRRIDEVVAGVNVTGTVKSPLLTLFSDPAMDESDALSYLLLGRPLNKASSSEGKVLQKAALSAGLSGGDLIARKIGSIFGLEEVGIEEGTGEEDASMVVGKYLSPRLYISYGIGLFEPISTYRIRYNISRRWLVQTEYGLNSGADLFYEIEW